MANAPHADDQRGGLAQVDIGMPAGVLVPAPLPLRLQVVRQPTRQRQHKHENVMADVVEVDPARVAHHHRVGNQRGVVIARGRPGLGILSQRSLVAAGSASGGTQP